MDQTEMMKSPSSVSKRIAVIGSGAVGTYYGARLAEAKHKVSFLARSHYENLKLNGISVTSPNGNIRIKDPNIFNKPQDIGIVDWILVSVKSYSIADALELMTPCVGPKTKIIVAMNGLGMENSFATRFCAEKIFGAIPYIAAYRKSGGEIHHVKYNGIEIGHCNNEGCELKRAKELWDPVLVDLTLSANLLYSRWSKVLFNFPFNGVSVTNGGITIEDIVQNPILRQQASDIIEELRLTANQDLLSKGSYQQIGSDFSKKIFSMLDTIGPYKTSTTLDFLEEKPLEFEYMFETPVQTARSLGVDCPNMDALYEQVKEVCKQNKSSEP
mmetsp:Transcript_38280/g.50449  ORF Transcript_38280/g.50449 Transcript_38280/m.50449 type:complete len:328 (+) Transcript_38280:56-1039(+)